jgi:hypothetical protein
LEAVGGVFPPEGRGQAPYLVGGEGWDGGSNVHRAGVLPSQVLADEDGEVDRFGEGAVATGGDGEAQQVGDRSRTDDGGPEPPYVTVVSGKPDLGVGIAPEAGFDHRTEPDRGAKGLVGEFGGARRWRRIPGDNGRTVIIVREGSGHRRDLMFAVHAI